MREDGQRYAALMAGPAFDSMERVPENTTGQATILGWMACQQAVNKSMNEIAWEASQLEPVTLEHDDGSSTTLEPLDYAKRLIGFAFSDAYDLITTAEKFLEQEGVSKVDRVEVLRQSSRELLRISWVSDAEKGRLMGTVKVVRDNPALAELMQIEDGPENFAQPFVLQCKDDVTWLTWNNSITSWLKNNMGPDVGCPANKQFVETPNGKVSVVHYFWDRLITVMYGA